MKAPCLRLSLSDIYLQVDWVLTIAVRIGAVGENKIIDDIMFMIIV